MITIHARKHHDCFIGSIKVTEHTQQGTRGWTESTTILRNNRMEALADADELRDWYLNLFAGNLRKDDSMKHGHVTGTKRECTPRQPWWASQEEENIRRTEAE